MNCDECKDLISVFMDNELDADKAAAVRMHLAVCDGCALVCEDFASILDVCNTEYSSEIVPPNAQAMWRRINNVIEHDVKKAEPPPSPPNRFWQLSFAQLVTAVACVAIVSSLATITAIRHYTQPDAADFTTRSSATQTTVEKVLSRIGLVDTPNQARERRLKEQQAAIDYWDERVQARRAQWDRATREAFDRNLHVIDETVHEYKVQLQNDPEDELSGEMLDAVMSDKMNLLRDFSDL